VDYIIDPYDGKEMFVSLGNHQPSHQVNCV
jgi:hypothetical protein